MREFLKWMAASAIGTVVGLIAFVALVGIGAGGVLITILATASQDVEPEVESGSLLVLDLATDIRDAVPLSGASIVLEETLSGSSFQQISIYQAIQAIRRAAEDEDIAGLYIYGNSGEGLATLRELREAITAFKEADKPIITYEVGLSERDYYITSLADTLILDQTGLIEVNGFRAETQFLAGTFEKYGVGVQILQAGRYKSAVEPFIRSENSPESAEQTQALLDDLWTDFLDTVGTARSLSPNQVQQLADNGGLLLANDAQTSGLIDQVSYYDDVLTELQSLTGDEPAVGEDITSIDLVAYSKIAGQEPNSRNEIALVYAEGEILLGEGGDGLIGAESLSRTLRDLRYDDDVKAVILRINSPGGGASASEIIADAVARLQTDKPVIVSMGNVAASGGYMIAAKGDRIFASPNTITGSIGVFGLLLNFQDIANRNGITWDVEKTARYADMNTVSRPQTDEELALQQAVVDELYERFVGLVAEARDLTTNAVDDVAQGRVWSGEDALEVGLVDEMGGLEAAIAYAAAQADIEDWDVQEYPRPRSLESQIFDTLFGQFATRFGPQDFPLSEELTELQGTFRHLQKLDDPHGAYTRLPYTTRIE
ncbi:MAG: signal peptide peptidase SppA [Cyanobacteria bacterium J06638_28]